MKKYLLIYFFLSGFIFAQVGYVESDNTVYRFLNRMENLGIIENYNSFEIPKTRNEISKFLKIIIDKKSELDAIDLKILTDYLTEFELELFGTTEKSSSLSSDISIESLLSEKEKYLYYYNDSTFNFFANFVGEGTYLTQKNIEPSFNENTELIRFGGILKGSFYGKIGFYLKGMNGTFFGNRTLALKRTTLAYNYKFNLENAGIGNDYFDETEGYLLGEFDHVKIKIGRDRINAGYGFNKSLLGNNSPVFDYALFNFGYKFFHFSYFHGKLLGNMNIVQDPIEGSTREVTEKYIAYHRVAFDFSKHLSIGFGEMIIYSRRSMDLAYLNPFAFYKSVEHSNQDRDNSMLFFDVKNNSIRGFKFYAALLIDDIDFSKIGKKWYGNQTLFDIGLTAIPFYSTVPIEFDFQYMRIEPYVYSHRINNNNFTTQSFNLASDIQPNSEIYHFGIDYRFTHRLSVYSYFDYTIHGANKLNNDGSVNTNYGGDIQVGYRVGDEQQVNFLDGMLEYKTIIGVQLIYEPINNYHLVLTSEYTKNNTFYHGDTKNIFGSLSFKIKI
ncbi:MAG: hypothetical protein K9J16_02715 [Melioribacteraceae bacterium]|nr:hypothetical protein [Melioribacteraceae bacterium]MCF8352920.1 hypothetical protein [Melioribacteraceae bacterium]MCF8395261.1 hypothetical protein [Melioribacteraceae bacterium]MCF8417437.1 hypothetical protein [Melioribacteraceae bacterium]